MYVTIMYVSTSVRVRQFYQCAYLQVNHDNAKE
jgi:hypothetical protein